MIATYFEFLLGFYIYYVGWTLLSQSWSIQPWQLLKRSSPITQSLLISGVWTGAEGMHRNEICSAGGEGCHGFGDAKVQLLAKFQESWSSRNRPNKPVGVCERRPVGKYCGQIINGNLNYILYKKRYTFMIMENKTE